MKTYFIIALLIALYPMLRQAEALTPEMKYIRSDVLPILKEADLKFEKYCGCPIKIEVDFTRLDIERLGFVRNFASDVATTSQSYCSSNTTNRRRICKLQAIQVMYGASTSVGYSLGLARVAIDNVEAPSWEMLVEEVDKY